MPHCETFDWRKFGRRFADLSSQAVQLALQLEATYGAEMAENDRVSVQAFEQHYPGRGREARDQHSNAETAAVRTTAERFTRAECDNIMGALEGFAALDDWSSLTATYLALLFDQARAITPTCQLSESFAVAQAIRRNSRQSHDRP